MSEIHDTLGFIRDAGGDGAWKHYTSIPQWSDDAGEMAACVEGWRRGLLDTHFTLPPGRELLFIVAPRRFFSQAPTTQSTTGNA